MKKIRFQIDIIDPSKILENAGSDNDGSILLFAGQARNNSNGKEVTHLEYEIYEDMALRELDKIADYAINKWKLSNCIIVHRYGAVKIGEISILISVSSPLRDDSYSASRYIIDTIKKKVPVWKKEFYRDGSHWIHDRN